MTDTSIEQLYFAVQRGDIGLRGFKKYVQAAIESRVLAGRQPIYQRAYPDGLWQDTTLLGYEHMPENSRRIVFTRPTPDDAVGPAITADVHANAARYRWLRDTLHGAKAGGGVEVNERVQVYETPEPGEEVRVYWYQVTPVGFYEVKAESLDAAIDAAMQADKETK